ncbi:MAG: hypothetical protein ACP5VE_14955 [Chthonomonadales bacterium]
MNTVDVFILVFGGLGAMTLLIPFYAIWTAHRRAIEEIRARARAQAEEATRQAVQELRDEFTALRDTATQYDLSFDTALKRLESRVAALEQRIAEQAGQPISPGRLL